MILQGKKIAFLGDSITQGVGASRPETAYVSLFKGAHPEASVYNYGISGTRISRQKEPSNHPHVDGLDFILRADTMEADLDVVFIFGGTNDYGHGTDVLGAFGDDTPYTFYGALRVLTEKLYKKYPLARIVYLTPLHRAGEDAPAPCVKGGEPLEKYAQAIRENAAYYSCPVVDLWGNANMQPNIPENNAAYFADGLHPNDNGHKRIFETVDSFLKNL